MAAEGLKVITYAYYEINVEDLSAIMRQFNPESDEFRETLEQEMVYVCTLGMEDPLREGVVESIEAIKTVPDVDVDEPVEEG